MRAALFILLLSFILLVSAGCAVIDFLDGKHLPPPDNNRPEYPQYRSGYGGSGGGHAH